MIERTGDILKPRTIFYNIQIYQLLPLLTPAQVNQLHEVSQIQHKQYLRAHGIEVKVWETIEAKGLMPQVVCWRGAELEPPMSLLGTKS